MKGSSGHQQQASIVYRSGETAVKWSDSSPLAQSHIVQELSLVQRPVSPKIALALKALLGILS